MGRAESQEDFEEKVTVMENSDNMKRQVISGLIWKFAENSCADIVSFVVSIILARLLMPSDYGEIALINIFIVLANVFVVNGLGTALIQKKDADDVDFSSVFYFNCVLSLGLYAILFISSPYIARFYRTPHLKIVLRVLALKILLAAINSVQNAYISRKMIFRKSFLVTLTGTIISAIVGIGMAYAGYGVWSLVAQVLTNSVIDTILMFVMIRWFPKWCFSFKRLKDLLNYGWKILASSLIKTGYDQISSLMIGKLYTGEDLAYYSRGKKYPDLVVTDINSTISTVLFPAIAKNQTDMERVKAITRRSIKTSTFVLTPLLIGLAALAEPLIDWMLTDKWLPCVPYLRVCCIYYLMQPVQTANLQAIRAIGRSDIILKLDIIKRGFGLLFLFALMHHGVMGIALAPVGMSVLATIVNILPNKKFIGYSYKEQFMDLVPNFAIAIFMGIAVYLESAYLLRLGLDSFLTVIMGFVSGACIYILSAVFLRIESMQYLLGMITNRKKQ